MKKMSNQQKWRLKHIAKGNCPNCGKPNETDFFNCQACHDKQVNRMRERLGIKPKEK